MLFCARGVLWTAGVARSPPARGGSGVGAPPPPSPGAPAAGWGFFPGLGGAGSAPGLLVGTRPDRGSLRQRDQLAGAAAANLPAVLSRALRAPSTRRATRRRRVFVARPLTAPRGGSACG